MVSLAKPFFFQRKAVPSLSFSQRKAGGLYEYFNIERKPQREQQHYAANNVIS
jgi:hypothetical protein